MGKETFSPFHWFGHFWGLKLVCPGVEGDRVVSTYSLVANRSYAATIIVNKVVHVRVFNLVPKSKKLNFGLCLCSGCNTGDMTPIQ